MPARKTKSKVEYFVLGDFSDGVEKFSFKNKEQRDEWFETMKSSDMTDGLYKGETKGKSIVVECCKNGQCSEHCVALQLQKKGISGETRVNVN